MGLGSRMKAALRALNRIAKSDQIWLQSRLRDSRNLIVTSSCANNPVFPVPPFPFHPFRTTEEVAKDSEVLVSYDYALDDAPPWYQEIYAMRILDQYNKSKTIWNS